MTPAAAVALPVTITILDAHSQVGCLFARLPCGEEAGGGSFKQEERHSESDFEEEERHSESDFEEEERHFIIPWMTSVSDSDLPGSVVFAVSVSACLCL